MLFKILFNFAGTVVLGETVGVIAVRQQEYLDVESLGQQHVDASQGGFDAGGVGIVDYGYILGEAVYEAYLPFGKRGAGRCNHIFHSALVHGNDIHVPFYKDALVLAHYGLFCLIKSVKLTAFLVNG